MPETFPAWLVRQAERRDPIGHLAHDARDDATFPVDGDLGTYREYLLDAGAADVARGGVAHG